eukprot:1140783-Pelagomonas_calceolata.AAC.9
MPTASSLHPPFIALWCRCLGHCATCAQGSCFRLCTASTIYIGASTVCVVVGLGAWGIVQAVLESPEAQQSETAGLQVALALGYAIYSLKENKRMPLGAWIYLELAGVTVTHSAFFATSHLDQEPPLLLRDQSPACSTSAFPRRQGSGFRPAGFSCRPSLCPPQVFKQTICDIKQKELSPAPHLAGKAAGLSLACLTVGALVGNGVEAWLRVDIVPIGVSVMAGSMLCMWRLSRVGLDVRAGVTAVFPSAQPNLQALLLREAMCGDSQHFIGERGTAWI